MLSLAKFVIDPAFLPTEFRDTYFLCGSTVMIDQHLTIAIPCVVGELFSLYESSC